MNTEMSDNNATQPVEGWICYDGDCAFCRRWLRRVEPPLLRRGFGFVSLQTPWVKAKLNVPEVELLKQMRLMVSDGRMFGGADAAVVLARYVWWLWPLWIISKIPGTMPIIRATYRVIAKNQHCASDRCEIHNGGKP